MCVPASLYQLQHACQRFFPHLRPAQQRGLALWVLGTILARSVCQSSVVCALSVFANSHALRQRLREWLYDGCDRRCACSTSLEVETCFAPLLRWVLTWWNDTTLPLAIDATLDRDRHAALVISVVYRGCAIPLAWYILPANTKGAWGAHLKRLPRLLWRAVPGSMSVIVLVDRGLWSPTLWRRLRRLGWHPVMRVQQSMVWESASWRASARQRVPGPGYAWSGYGRLGRVKACRLRCTLLVVWGERQSEPWVIATDLAPDQIGLGYYGLRMWIESGFKVIKSMGWNWERTRRKDVRRVSRMWLVMAVATLWTLATGTRVAQAQANGRPAWQLRKPIAPASHTARQVSVFKLGITWLQQLARRRLWTQLWLWPDPLPQPPSGLQLVMQI